MLASSLAMHIPDGFLSLNVLLLCWLITIIVDGIAIARTNRSLGEQRVPLMGVMAAFIFAAQMINFPVAGGTSGHLLGGVLAAIVFGPWVSMLVMTAVIAVQGLLFQDGGLLAMGANILNMGLATAAVGYGLYRSVLGRDQRVKLVIAGGAAWLSVMAAALLTSLELWLSGTARLAIVVPAMLGIHALIGVGEALITAAALAFIFRTRPDLLAEQPSSAARGGRGWIAAGLLITLAVLFLSPFASLDPDGLNRVAMEQGFLQAAQSGSGALAGYVVPFVQGPASRIAAGLLGALVVLAIILLAGRLLRKKAR